LTIALVCATQPSSREDPLNPPQFAGRGWRIVKTLLALVLFWHATAVAAGAQSQSLEMRLEAAFLYNFARFVEWPNDSGAPSSTPVTFCVLGSAEFQDALEQSLAGKTLNGHPVLARRIGHPGDTLQCRVAFIGWDERKHMPAVLEALNGAPVLTVADFEQFASHGGMIQLNKQGNKFHFAVNVDAVTRHGLRVSSKLLQLAELVHESGTGGSKP
jgi:hypothetical protein